MTFAFELRRRFVAQTRMHACRVVPALGVSEYAVHRRGPGGKVLTMSFFHFQRMPITLHRRIVIAIAGAAHRLPHGALGEPDTHLVTGVLAAAIRMKDQA